MVRLLFSARRYILIKMKMSQFFRFMLLCSMILYGTVATPSGSPGTTVQQSYDELFLVLQWPVSYCNTRDTQIRCSSPIPNRFTVHGLWPQQNGRSVSCAGATPTKLHLSQIKQHNYLLDNMNYHWPNLNSNARKDFLWLHEYQNHGSCIWDFRNQVDYFRSTIIIANNIGDVTTKLLHSGKMRFKPGNSYWISDLRQAIFDRTNLMPRLRCNTDKHGTPQLKEIVFCADRRRNLKNCTFQVTGCPYGWFQFSKSSTTTGEL